MGLHPQLLLNNIIALFNSVVLTRLAGYCDRAREATAPALLSDPSDFLEVELRRVSATSSTRAASRLASRFPSSVPLGAGAMPTSNIDVPCPQARPPCLGVRCRLLCYCISGGVWRSGPFLACTEKRRSVAMPPRLWPLRRNRLPRRRRSQTPRSRLLHLLLRRLMLGSSTAPAPQAARPRRNASREHQSRVANATSGDAATSPASSGAAIPTPPPPRAR